MNNREKGNYGEDIAIDYLVKEGYSILETNYSNKIGEIDIIGRDQKTIAFIEVKARKTTRLGRPYEAVNYYKQQKIIRVAYMYAQKYHLMERPLRFDVVEIIGNKIKLTKNAFSVEGNSRYL